MTQSDIGSRPGRDLSCKGRRTKKNKNKKKQKGNKNGSYFIKFLWKGPFNQSQV